MGLFESSDYQKNALTELERRFRMAEEEKKQKGTVNVKPLQAVMDFAIATNLLRQQQIEIYRNRMEKLQDIKDNIKGFEKLKRESFGDIDDGFTNPYERGKQISMEIAMKEIENVREYNSNSASEHSGEKHMFREEERTRN